VAKLDKTGLVAERVGLAEETAMSETTGPISSGAQRADAVSEAGDFPIAAEHGQPSGGSEPPRVPSSPRAPRTRKIFAGVFVVLFSISLLVTVLAVWSVRQVLNTNAFAGHVEVALKSPAVQTELSNYVANEVVKVIQPEKIAAARLPPKAQALASPLATAFDSLITKTTNKLVANPTFQRVILTAVTKTHQAAVNLLEGKPAGNLEVHGNAVVLNTLPLIDTTIKALETQTSLGRVLHAPRLAAPDGDPSAQLQQLSSKFGVSLAPDFGQIVVFRTDNLQQEQQALKKVRRLLIALLILTIVLFAAAFAVSIRRLRTLGQIGIGVTVVMTLAWAATVAATNVIAGHPKQPEGRAAVSVVVNNFTGGLELLVGVLAILGVLATILAFIFGPSKTAGRIRSRLARWWSEVPGALSWVGGEITTHVGGARVLGGVVGLLILVLVGFNWPGIIATLVVEAIWQGVIALVLRRRATRQIPPPAPA
jgi:hypothetical protein